MGTTTPRAPHGSAPRLEDRRALLQRVLWSPPIEKSARIRDLLTFICERSFEDAAAEIHEQEIGHRVFGRPAGYETAHDNVVRVTVSQARKKLEQYFAGEGSWEPVVLEIPKGRYTPDFRERHAEVAPPAASAVAPATRRPSRAVIILSAACCIFAICAAGGWWQLRAERWAAASPVDRDPVLGSLWSQLLSTGGGMDIVVTDSSLSLFQELLDHQLSLAEYLSVPSWSRADALAADPGFQKFAQTAAQRRFTSIGSVTAAYRIAKLAGSDENKVSIFSARDFNIRQMKFDNVVLLGSRRANPWMELVEDRLNFRFGYDEKTHRGYFENRHPEGNAPAIYRMDAHTSYCQVAFVPNLDGAGNILAIGGTEVEGTEGGGEFVTDSASLAQLRQLIHVGSDGRLPYFEILLRSDRVGGVAPKFSIVFARTIKI
jgi:hypothetical protein